jgi:RHS repeat-associated protein
VRKFTGKERDAETGLDYFGARYFSAAQGRFTSPDPLLNSGRPEIPQSWNRYSYTLNNPLKYVDPDGLWEWEADKCAKNDKECQSKRDREQQWFKDAVATLDEAIRIADPKSLEYQELQIMHTLIGTEGDGGIVVSFDIGRLKGKGSGGSKSEIVYLDAKSVINSVNAWKNAGHPVDMRVESAASVTHEFSHQLDAPARNALDYQRVLSNERRAYRMQSDVNYVFNKESIWGLWNPAWAKVDAQKLRETAIRDNAKRSTDEAFKLK